ncbi:Nramp family divalent metal transporter [Calorimonas adulescens]|jgi:Natural resistance-associated macrophage protein.|uniref:Divalent metal cation transporter n=1 Tax=Calorimonas adulescens TaxID=2606906 RepID=A0A5D8QG22_9THEO|nr:Nramp family divalent metal transporter [Calorimonas adulescens]TZE82796.1 divalent metal cation transporter [Calorimonas adulescens]
MRAGDNKLKNILTFLSIIGPGLVAAAAGDDAGGIATYATVGSAYGYKMLWGLLFMTFSLAVAQEMCSRMGTVTGKGLSALIREQFGVRWTFLAMLALLIANITIIISEFAGIAASMELFGISKYISVPIMAIIIWFIVIRGNYTSVEKFFLSLSLALFTYIITAFIVKPDWNIVLHDTFVPSFEWDRDFIQLFIGMVGTTIAPWMQFFLQSSIVDKGITIKHYKYERLDVYTGAIMADFIAFFIIVTTAATLNTHGISINTAADAAIALRPLAGKYATFLFGIGLFGASVMAASVLPLSTSYVICEAFGWESGLDNKFSEAPIFYSLYTILIIIGAGVITLFSVNLIEVMLVSQVINGILVPIILIFIIKLANNKELMGEYVNSKTFNIIAWITAVFIIILTVLLLLFSVI